ncbi:efflux RND transporter periplasmic adaptor subunit [Samsonia erythrinae]|uniref:Multidrug efflux system membrane fusion protein n=1 Tax=Samsonia erythrinae TaxID=160434 RepID=A0A4V2VTH6_9GAMM|nr:efflux RND transporter periplasmic adaptor subunit [Samsonia erythrinae]TCV06957.1 multidrug efflux system membrane fusion protein [Samsonia erythrinae]
MTVSFKRRVVCLTVVIAVIGTLFLKQTVIPDAHALELTSLQTVQTTPAVVETVNDWVEFSGKLEATDEVTVRSRVAGAIVDVKFRDGQLVRKGDILFVIDPAPYKAELERARAAYAQAKAKQDLALLDLSRGKKLIGTHAISQRDFDVLVNAAQESKAARDIAGAELERASLEESYTRITALVSGRISRAELTVGNLVAAGSDSSVLASIVALDPVYVAFNADERTYLRYIDKFSQKDRPEVLVGLADEKNFPHKAILNSVDNRLSTETGTIRMRALLNNPSSRLLPGLQARVRLQASKPYQAVLIDQTLIRTDQDRRYVLVVGNNDKVEYRALELGSRQGTRIVVENGLSKGDKVISGGAQLVRPGDTVRISKDAPLSSQLQEGKP